MNTLGTSDPTAPVEDPEHIALKAAEWSDALREGNADLHLRRAFEQWRDAHPAHAAAFERVDTAYRLAQSAHGSRAMVAFENDVLAMGANRSRRRWRRRALGWGLAASVAAVVTAGLVVTGGSWSELQYLQARARHALAGETLYRAAVGERYAVTLDDGTALTLNTDSRAAVRFDDGVRQVRLLQGQALFEVAKNPQRPFIVTAGTHRVTALGTAFDVRLSPQQFEVTLIEGKVEVTDAELPPATAQGAAPAAEGGPPPGVQEPALSTVLSPGQKFTVALAPEDVTTAPDVAATAPPRPAPVVLQTDVRKVISWREGRVIFEGDRLDEAVAEMNRYGIRRVELANTELGALRISGIFNTGNPNVFVETLTQYLPLQVVAADPERIVLAASGG
ncbi:FecR domain-containing protein [Flagellatimonas centrodinii]|uniref:FecR family protein n=1 Tax=Flagellatimonas centrodinii TaxID=2806210 RepID=UPI001FF00F74|nr:FecR domain-containing protein [Flagellatimonas centrodinii]ULQ48007.1 FecR domain-containing protein [Flagellatimonas centrodinii]